MSLLVKSLLFNVQTNKKQQQQDNKDKIKHIFATQSENFKKV